MELTIYRKISLVGAFGILMFMGILNAPSLTELPLQSPDSVDYLSGYGRPWLIVTWWNTLGVSVTAVWASYLLSLFCWARLGWVTGGVIGVYLALLCSSGEIIYSWHFRVLSEGVAWSGIALLAAETTVMARRPSRRHAWQWIIAIALNTVRVTSGLTALATIPVIWKAGWRSYWWAIVLAILLCLSPSIQQAPTTYTDCQVDSIILGRVAMDNPKMLKQFRAAGMPWPIDQQWIGQLFPEREEIRKDRP